MSEPTAARTEVLRLVVALINYAKGEPVAAFEDKTLAEIADMFIATSLGGGRMSEHIVTSHPNCWECSCGYLMPYDRGILPYITPEEHLKERHGE